MPIAGEGYLGYTGATGWMYWVAAWMAIGLGSVATQDLMQRSMAARNQATSVYGSYGAGILYLVFGIMSPLIGIMMFKLSPGMEDTGYLLVKAATDHLQPIFTAIFLAALVSALMSTSDSSLLAGASAVTENLIPVITGKKLEGKTALWWTRGMVIFNALVGISIALWAQTIYELSVLAWSSVACRLIRSIRAWYVLEESKFLGSCIRIHRRIFILGSGYCILLQYRLRRTIHCHRL